MTEPPSKTKEELKREFLKAVGDLVVINTDIIQSSEKAEDYMESAIVLELETTILIENAEKEMEIDPAKEEEQKEGDRQQEE